MFFESRNIQEFTDFQMITLFLGKNLVRKRQELTYFHTENKSIPFSLGID